MVSCSLFNKLYSQKITLHQQIKFDRIKFDINKAQKLLNDYIPIKKVARIIKASETSLRNAISDNILKLPKDFKKISMNQTELVRLTMDGEYIDEFKNSHQAEVKLGVNRISIDKKQNNKIWYRYGFVFVEKSAYYNNDYVIEDIVQNHCKTFYMIDENMNILKTYTSLKDAVNDIEVSHSTYIINVLKGKKENVKGYKFIWKYKYDELLQ